MGFPKPVGYLPEEFIHWFWEVFDLTGLRLELLGFARRARIGDAVEVSFVVDEFAWDGFVKGFGISSLRFKWILD